MKYLNAYLFLLISTLSVNSYAALISRDLDGNFSTVEAYYDNTANLTWLADANYSMSSGYDADGRMTWRQSIAWVEQIEINGYNNWRLPTTPDSDADCRDWQTQSTCLQGEMAQLYYNSIYNGDPLSEPNHPFLNVQTDYSYWSSSSFREYAFANDIIFAFGFSDIGQNRQSPETSDYYAWAVHDGDIGVAISTVPVPAAVWLFGSGLIGLAVFIIKD